VPQQFEGSIDRRWRQGSVRLPIHDARQLQVSDEVLDVGGLDVLQRTIAEPIDERFEPVVDRAGVRESLRLDVPLLVDLRELAESQSRDVTRRLKPALVEPERVSRGAAAARRARQVREVLNRIEKAGLPRLALETASRDETRLLVLLSSPTATTRWPRRSRAGRQA